MARWSSLYLFSDTSLSAQQVRQQLEQAITSLGYRLYNPFGLIPGMAYPRTLRTFVFAFPASNWYRIPLEAEVDDIAQVAQALSENGVCLAVWLEGKEADIAVYQNGRDVDVEPALIPLLQAGKTADDLNRALNNVATLPPLKEEQHVSVVPVELLPEDVQAMAQDLNPKQTQKMFDKISKRFLQSDQQDAAKGLLGGDAPDWDSAGGQRIRAVMACLQVPEQWREPDFTTLRTAYALHARRKRKPDARLYPGDEEEMLAVPNALEYIPIYGGKES